jgi:predicted outer membrane repeat protein
VLVADGTYTGDGNKNLQFITGRAITVRSENGPELCIIDCQDNGRGFFFHHGEGLDTVVSGFTITNGDVTDGGGAMKLDSASPTITNCIISGNTSSQSGGAMHLYCAAPIITNCIFTENTAQPRGGAIFSDCSASTMTNCIFTGNEASSQGGAIYASCSSPAITNCTITNNTVTGTQEDDKGAGIYSQCSSATITNCILWGNTQQGQQPGNGVFESNEICACGGRTPTVTYCVVQGGYPGQGNIDADPLFVDAAAGDYRLCGGPVMEGCTEVSPCIDAGDNDAVPADILVDFDGNTRFFASSCADDTGKGTPPIVDIGAYEFQFLDADPEVYGGPDGMEDCWEIQHFGTLERDGTGDYDLDGSTDLWEFQNGMNPEVNDAFQDPDEDGFCNVREFRGDSDPNDGENTPLVPLTIHVDVGATGSENGSSTYPFNTIQEGINCAADFKGVEGVEGSDTVEVRNGTYTDTGNKNLDFKGKAITVKSQNGPGACSIDCEGVGRGFYFHRGEKADSVLRGFTVKNGSVADSGGGIYCSINSSPKIDNCVILDNSATFDGGGVYCYRSSPVITNSTMQGNSSKNGGGVYCTYSSLTLTNCTFSNNSADQYGGALFCRYYSPTVMNCTITGNTAGAGFGGGGVYCKDSDPQITNTIFDSNSEYAVYEANANSDPTVTYCLFFENLDGDYYDENTTGYTGPNNINLNIAEADNNVSGNPMFVDGDYHLGNGSYAIDRGTKEGAPETDFEGDLRPVVPWPDPESPIPDEPVDIGVDEADWNLPPGVDGQPPISYVEGAAAMVTTTTFEVPWFASDGESGVQGVELWYRKDGGTWIKYGSNFTASPITFQSSTTGGDGFYEFYTVATDNAGNKESSPHSRLQRNGCRDELCWFPDLCGLGCQWFKIWNKLGKCLS